MPPSVGCSSPEPSRSARPHHSASLHGPPSYGAEGGTGSRRRQPSASAANENIIAILLIIRGIAIIFYETVAKIGFKSNNPNDNLLLPPCLGDFLPQNNPARVVSAIVERMRGNAELRS